MLTTKPRWWQWPTVLSLDAPAVALAWQALVARQAGVKLAWPPIFVLGTSVWLAYSVDRWIEGWRLPPERVRTQRHLFSQRARWPIAAVWSALFVADVTSALGGLSRHQFWAGTWLLPLVAIYLFSHQLVHRNHRWRVPKEVCVALLLAGGLAVFVAPILPAHNRGRVAVPTAAFAVLAFANCALISVWERGVDHAHEQISLARQFAAGDAVARTAAWMAVGLGVLTAAAMPAFRMTGVAAASSGGLLIWVDRSEPRIGARLARVLADLVLLTPLPLLLWAH